MKVIIIYGPPGVGKMSVAKELVKITKSKYLPHNLIFELIMPVIGEKTNDDVLWDLYEEIKIAIIKSAKEKKKEGIILTEIYNRPFSNERFKEFVGELKKAKIKFYFIKLRCSKEKLNKRVSSKNRKNTKKISSIKFLNRIMTKNNLDSEIPFVKSIVIDTTKLSAKKTSQEIKRIVNNK